jgi:hypothetical protein
MLDLRFTMSVLLAALAAVTALEPAAAQCVGLMHEGHPPPAVEGISTIDPGFRVRYWAWDDFNRRRGGQAEPVLIDAAHGVLISELDWADADICLEPGPVLRTAVLMEALSRDGFGLWGLVNLSARGEGGEIHVDRAQTRTGQRSSRAVPVPRPWIEEIHIDDEDIRVRLAWTVDPRGEALSDLIGDHGWPLRSVRGFAVYVINGPAATPRPWDWSFGHDTERDAVNGFSTDTSATLLMPRGIWNDVSVCFAVALTFDGNGDAEGELPDSRSVHGEHLGAPSRWIALPPIGVDAAVGIVDLEASITPSRLLGLSFIGQAEPAGASYRAWIHPADGRRFLASSFDGGAGSYEVAVELPAWGRGPDWDLVLEMLDGEGRVVDTAKVVPAV